MNNSPPAQTLTGQGRLQALSLRKAYRSKRVIEDVSLHVDTGEVVGLLGPNGAGKTTCFYMIVGLVSADEGETWIAKKIDYDGSIFAVVEAPETRTVVAMGLRGNAFRLPFGAAQWEEVSTNLRETFSGATVLADGSMIVVGSRGILARSTDDFRTIQVVRRTDKLPSASVVQLNDQEILLAGLRGFKTLSLSEFK